MNWIVFVLVLFLSFIVLFAISLSKQKRGDILLIDINNNMVKLYLSDDEYLNIDISDIKNNEEKVYNKIKEIIKSRAFELKNLVYKVQFFKNRNEAREKELLNLLK